MERHIYLAEWKAHVFETRKDDLLVLARSKRSSYTTHRYFLLTIRLQLDSHPASYIYKIYYFIWLCIRLIFDQYEGYSYCLIKLDIGHMFFDLWLKAVFCKASIHSLVPLSLEPVMTRFVMLTRSRPLEMTMVRWSIFPQPFVSVLSESLFKRFWSFKIFENWGKEFRYELMR